MSDSTALTAQEEDKFIAAIELRHAMGQIGAGTARQYKRAVVRAREAEIDLLDAESVAEYAATLPSSSRAFLRGAIRAFSDRAIKYAKSQATPENVQNVQAAVYRLEAMRDSIDLDSGSGQAAALWLTPAQVRQLVNLPDPSETAGLRDKVILALLLGSGLRRAEAAALCWKHLVSQGQRTALDIEGKGRKKRVVPISSTLAQLLQRWKTACVVTDDEERVLRSVNKAGRIGADLTPAAIYNIVQRYGAQIDKPELAPHDLRRTYAQIGLDSGIEIQQISQLLGHATLATTQKYLNIELDLKSTISDFIPLE